MYLMLTNGDFLLLSLTDYDSDDDYYSDADDGCDDQVLSRHPVPQDGLWQHPQGRK